MARRIPERLDGANSNTLVARAREESASDFLKEYFASCISSRYILANFASYFSPGFPELRDSPHELGHDRAVFPRQRRPPAVGANSSGYLSKRDPRVHPVGNGNGNNSSKSPARSGSKREHSWRSHPGLWGCFLARRRNGPPTCLKGLLFTSDYRLVGSQTTPFSHQNSAESLSPGLVSSPLAYLELHKPCEGDRFSEESRCVHQTFL